MGSHAKLSPSAAKRWMTCAVAPRREVGLPDTSGPAAKWGTACHSILEKALLTFEEPNPQMANEFWYPLDDATKKVADLMEMVATAKVAYDYVIQQQQARMPADVRAETKVNPGQMIGNTECWGTADVNIVSHDILEIIDLKGGKGVVVEPTDPQLTLYGIGSLADYGGRSAPFSIVRCTIIQPRAPHEQGSIRSVDYTVDEIMRWCEREFSRAVALTYVDNAVATPSEDGCRYCKAKSTCQELSQVTLAAAQGVFQPLEPVVVEGEIVQSEDDLEKSLTREPNTLSDEAIRYVLDNSDLISGWLKSVRDYATERGKQGKHIPGYKMVPGKSNRSWTAPVEEDGVEDTEALMIKLTQGLKKEDGKRLGKTAMLEEPKLMSPAQAEKKVKPLLPTKTWDKIKARIVKAGGSPTLAPETDKRNALLMGTEVFKPLPDQTETKEPAPAAMNLDFLT